MISGRIRGLHRTKALPEGCGSQQHIEIVVVCPSRYSGLKKKKDPGGVTSRAFSRVW
jgi:hypothetical protein